MTIIYAMVCEFLTADLKRACSCIHLLRCGSLTSDMQIIIVTQCKEMLTSSICQDKHVKVCLSVFKYKLLSKKLYTCGHTCAGIPPPHQHPHDPHEESP